jgi:hypothetical protein
MQSASQPAFKSFQELRSFVTDIEIFCSPTPPTSLQKENQQPSNTDRRKHCGRSEPQKQKKA